MAGTADDVRLRRWLGDAWAGLAALPHPATGLPADAIDEALTPASRTTYTSPTNIAGYLWSTLAAAELGLLPRADARGRLARVLRTLARVPRHAGSGMFYNWYDVATGEATTTWGRRGRPLPPFLSSVDNAWLALALGLVATGEPGFAAIAEDLLGPMRFDAFYDAAARPAGGLMRGGFWERPQRHRSVPAEDPTGGTIHVTRHHYALLNSETRLVTYVALGHGQVGPEAYAALDAPEVSYGGRRLVASLGGSVFEALAVPALLPEGGGPAAAWTGNHAATVAGHRAFAAAAGWPVWGLTPCACPGPGYRAYSEFGVPALGILGDGYRTTWHGQGVVAPHATALALPHDREAALANLVTLETLGCYGPGGFADAIGVRSGRTPGRYLALDQAFLVAGLADCAPGAALRALVPAGLAAIVTAAAGGPGGARGGA